jgi:aspartate aminotransferase
VEDFSYGCWKASISYGERIWAAPAEGFYKTRGLGKNELRIAYVLEEEPLTKAMRILSEGLHKYMELNKIKPLS